MLSEYLFRVIRLYQDWIGLQANYSVIKRYNSESVDAVYMVENQLFWSKKKIKLISDIYKRKLLHKYGIFIGDQCTIRKNLHLPHPNGIVIGGYVNIGDNCTIYQQVTIGVKKMGVPINKNSYPTIGNNVILCAGSKVLGGISVADGTIVGANTVIHRSTEPYTVWRGNPAVCINKDNRL